jgi:hypothetical protein
MQVLANRFLDGEKRKKTVLDGKCRNPLIALSRLKHEFDSRWGQTFIDGDGREAVPVFFRPVASAALAWNFREPPIVCIDREPRLEVNGTIDLTTILMYA